MWKWFYDGAELLELPILSMGIFMVVFAAQVIRSLRRREHDEHDANLVFDDGAGAEQ